MPFDLREKVIVITGGAGGIGRGLVSYFVEQGCKVVAVDRNEEIAGRLRKDLAAEDERADVFVLDITDVPAIQPVFDAIAEKYGAIDILVNCAGMGNPIPALDVSLDDWDTMMNLNLRGMFFCSQAAGRHMLKRGYGRIVSISSQISLVANLDEVVYCASKGGMNQVIRCLANEWSKEGVIVSGVCPTFTYTPGTKERLDDPAFREGVLSRIPKRQLGKISDISAAIHYLASDEAEMACGTILTIDGGWTIV